MNDSSIGFIGLGNVGSKVANNIISNGYKLFVYDLDEKNKYVSILPGSRKSEINNMMPTYLGFMKLYERTNKKVLFLIPAVNNEDAILIESFLMEEKINYKIREHSVSKIPVLMICGAKEVQNKTITIRKFGLEQQQTMSLDEAMDKLSLESRTPSI